jgi:tetratricopeptide (TPR) repeat protein
MTPAPRKPLFSSDYQFDILICLGLVLAIFIPYRQVAGHRFTEFDDGIYTFYNTYIIRGLCWESIRWAFTNTEAANWHPLTWLSHLIDRELFSSHPGGYLLENVAWHALASCLCYLAFLKATGSRLFAFTVALFFALHPANVENVAWTAERKSILNAVFWFSAIIAYLAYLETRSFASYGLTIIFHILGLLSKAMSVTLPCTLILIHLLYLSYHPDRRDTSSSWLKYVQKLIVPILPLLALSIYFSAVTMSAQSIAMADTVYPVGHRLINVLLSYERYLAMFFCPRNLAVFYPLFFQDLAFRQAIPAILILCALSLLALLLVRRQPQLLIGWCWFLGTMVPVAGLVQVGSQSHADRYLYIPMLGLAFVFPVLFEELHSMGTSARRVLIGVSLAGFGISMIVATQIQVSYWQDGVTLFQHSLSVTGDCETSVQNVAVAYSRAERYRELIAFCDSKIAVAQNPLHKGELATFKASALNNTYKYEAAIESALKALAWGDAEVSTYWVLALSHYRLGHSDKALEYLKKARAIQPARGKTDFVAEIRGLQMVDLEEELKASIALLNKSSLQKSPDPGSSGQR